MSEVLPLFFFSVTIKISQSYFSENRGKVAMCSIILSHSKMIRYRVYIFPDVILYPGGICAHAHI